jgi:hypothetical protein
VSIDEFASITPVSPPTVKRKIKPRDQSNEGLGYNCAPYKVPIQLKILIPVGTAIIIVAAVK